MKTLKHITYKIILYCQSDQHVQACSILGTQEDGHNLPLQMVNFSVINYIELQRTSLIRSGNMNEPMKSFIINILNIAIREDGRLPNLKDMRIMYNKYIFH